MPFIAKIKRILKKLSCFHNGDEEASKPITIVSSFYTGTTRRMKVSTVNDHKGAPTNFQRIYTELDLQYGFLKESSVIIMDIFENILNFSRHAAAAQAAVNDFSTMNLPSSNTLALEEQPAIAGYAGSNDDITLAGGSDVEKH
jgi:hypothetical protein